MPKIKTTNLSKYFIDKKKNVAVAALYDVNCDIPSNSFCVIVGKSGCGKTTLLKTLVGLLRADEGEIYFGETNVTDVAAQNRNVSLLTQEYALYPHLTVFDNIAYPLKLMRAGADEIRKRVGEVCDLLDIGFLASRRIKQCSGGQLQRVALARALVKNPDIVFLDEPLSNLDEQTRVSVSLEFAKLQKKLSATFVYVTHSIAEARRLATYIVVMDNGTVVQQGAAQEVISDKSGLFYEFMQAENDAAALRQSIVNDGDDDDEII